MSTMIETKDLTFTYPAPEGETNPPALNGVSVTVEKGSFVVVLGHNGSGKSTLAKHMNAVLLPGGGAVYVEGMDTRDESLLLEIRRRTGMVFQNPDNQIVANVVEEDVAFGPENLGVPRRRYAAGWMTRWPLWAWRNSPATRRIFCPADRSSVWPSPASSPWSRSASCWMRPPPCWTPPAGGRYWTPSTV